MKNLFLVSLLPFVWKGRLIQRYFFYFSLNRPLRQFSLIVARSTTRMKLWNHCDVYLYVIPNSYVGLYELQKLYVLPNSYLSWTVQFIFKLVLCSVRQLGAVGIRPYNQPGRMQSKRPQAKGWFTLVDCFPAWTDGVHRKPGVIAELILSQGGWCLCCRTTWCCRHKALPSRRGPDTTEKDHMPKTG